MTHPRQQGRGCSIKVDYKPSSVPRGKGVYGPKRPSSSSCCEVAAIHLGPALPQGSSGQPGGWSGYVIAPLFGLAPGGVCPAPAVTGRAVSSYLAISPLSACADGVFLLHFPSGRPAPPLAGAHARRCSDFPPLDVSRSGRPSALVGLDDSSAGPLFNAVYRDRRRFVAGATGPRRSSTSARSGLTMTRSKRMDMACLATFISCPVAASTSDAVSPRESLPFALAARALPRFSSGNLSLPMSPWPEATDLIAFMNSRSAVVTSAACLAEEMRLATWDPTRDTRPDLASCNNWSLTSCSSSAARHAACPSTLPLPDPVPPGHS